MTQKKSLRQARDGDTAALSLGRQHGCAPEQIAIMPGDDCDPLTAKMQPAIDKSRAKLRKEVGDNFAGELCIILPPLPASPPFAPNKSHSATRCALDRRRCRL